MKRKSEIERSWNQLAKLAKAHLAEGGQFKKLCIKHYGIYWQSIEALKDEDRIIDTIDYGYDNLSFKEFDTKVQIELKKAKNAKK